MEIVKNNLESRVKEFLKFNIFTLEVDGMVKGNELFDVFKSKGVDVEVIKLYPYEKKFTI